MMSARTSCVSMFRRGLLQNRAFADGAQRSALVTGGAQGIGEAVSRRLAQDGYKVVVCDLTTSQGMQVAKDIGGIFIPTDVTKHEEVERAVAETVKEYGTLDAVVNNAGIVGAQLPLHEYDIEEFTRVINVNLFGAFFVLKYSLAQMVKQPTGGNIVNMSSTSALRGMPNLSPYTASKSALKGLTAQAAVEYAQKKIRVNALAPAAVETEMVRTFLSSAPNPEQMRAQIMGQYAMQEDGLIQPSDVAGAAAFLLSDDARYITGTTLTLDAGGTCRMANAKDNFCVR